MPTSTSDKSHVGLSQCWWCLEDKNELMMDLRLRDSLPHRCVYNMEPCDKCKGLMEKGIILIGATEESMANIERDRELHQRQVDALPYSRRNKAMPFVPNPYRTGHWFVVSEQFVRNNFKEPHRSQVLKCRWCLIDPELGAQLQEHWDNVELEGDNEEKESQEGSVPDAPSDAV